MSKALKLIVSLVVPFIAAGVGSIATAPNISTWYRTLEKPFFNPPDWIFGPVWTVLYVLMGISLYLVWTAPSTQKHRALLWFGIQLAFNALWSVVFFGLHAPVAALIVILLLLISIIFTMRVFWPLSRRAAYLLLPYLAWVLFATVLNAAIAVLN